MPAPVPFEVPATLYDALIDWPKRLANEEPFYRRLFESIGARLILDAACGTGHHAAMFHSWGLSVEGADVSRDMIALCRSRYGEAPGLSWVVRSFEQGVPGSDFDAAVCVGNSLALAASHDRAAVALRALAGSVRPGGLIIIQVLNLWRIEEGPTLWQKCLRAASDGREHILLKSVHRCGDRGYIDIADMLLEDGAVRPTYESATFLGLTDAFLREALHAAGAEVREVLGSFQGARYDSRSSPDLILEATRRS